MPCIMGCPIGIGVGLILACGGGWLTHVPIGQYPRAESSRYTWQVEQDAQQKPLQHSPQSSLGVMLKRWRSFFLRS